MPAFVVGVDGALVSSFFSRFFPLFDTQRSALLDAYSDSATFSFQANTSIPARARIQGFQYSKEMPHQRNLEWSTWLGAGHGGSRNLSRIANMVDKMVKSMHVGREAVIGALEALPRTRHEMEGEGAGERFCVDGWPVQQGEMACLFLSIHGQFVECEFSPLAFLYQHNRFLTVGVDVWCSADRRCPLLRPIVHPSTSSRRLKSETRRLGRRDPLRPTRRKELLEPRSVETRSFTRSGAGSFFFFHVFVFGAYNERGGDGGAAFGVADSAGGAGGVESYRASLSPPLCVAQTTDGVRFVCDCSPSHNVPWCCRCVSGRA